MPEEWLVATWGMPFNRATNLRKGQDSEYFTMDAQPEDLAILEKKISVSHPHCFATDQPDNECWGEPDLNKTKTLAGQITLIIDVSGNHGTDMFPLNASVALQVPVVGIDSSFDGALNCLPENPGWYLGSVDKNCYKRSFIDVTNRLYELAEWMGIDTRNDRDLLCKSTQRFQDALKEVHNKGIRFLTASIQDGAGFGINGLTMFITNPLHFSMTRTMEEIGLPILWPGLCQEEICKSMGELPAAYEIIPADLYFQNCPAGQIEPECAQNPMYKADFLLLEGYGLEQYEDDPEGFAAGFPDPALLAGQFMAFPYDNHVWSHKALAGWLDAFTERIKKAKRIHEPTACSEAHVTSLTYINYGELEMSGGEYACWNPQYYNSEYSTCPPKEQVIESGMTDGAVAGIAVGAVVVGAMLMFVIMKFVLGYRYGIDKSFQASADDNDKDNEESIGGKEIESNTSEAPSQQDVVEVY